MMTLNCGDGVVLENKLTVILVNWNNCTTSCDFLYKIIHVMFCIK